MRNLRKVFLASVAAVFLVLALGACSDDEKDKAPEKSESESRDGSYKSQVANQPAVKMGYSPTRNVNNFWVETWDEPGKLAFVYLQSGDGSMLGYYVLEGPPVSKCTGLTPPVRVEEPKGDGDGLVVLPNPSVDGVFYSGGECNTYYGKDATTGSYIEYTAGFGINVLLFDEPMPRQTDAQPLGQTTVEDVPAA